jgi:hypothetical protein
VPPISAGSASRHSSVSSIIGGLAGIANDTTELVPNICLRERDENPIRNASASNAPAAEMKGSLETHLQ